MDTSNKTYLVSLFCNRKRSLRVRLCQKGERVVAYNSSKTFYNHTHGKKACCLSHDTLTSDNVNKLIDTYISNEVTICRKQRNDVGKKHKYPINSRQQSESSLAAYSFPQLSEVPGNDLFEHTLISHTQADNETVVLLNSNEASSQENTWSALVLSDVTGPDSLLAPTSQSQDKPEQLANNINQTYN